MVRYLMVKGEIAIGTFVVVTLNRNHPALLTKY